MAVKIRVEDVIHATAETDKIRVLVHEQLRGLVEVELPTSEARFLLAILKDYEREGLIPHFEE